MEIKQKLNGRQLTRSVEPDRVLLDFLRGQGYVRFAYETDCANLPSVRLAQRLGGTVVRREEVRTESGKRLQLDLYEID